MVDDGCAPHLPVRQQDLRVVRRNQFRHEQRQRLHLSSLAGDLDVITDVEGPEQQQHHAGGEIGERAL
ncbi:hypothetical protein ACVWW7_007435 [Bradyrhizobium sp. LM6.9]